MNNEFYAISLKTFNTIWGAIKTCDDSDNTFEIVRLGNPMRNRIYRIINEKLMSRHCFSDNDCSLDEEAVCNNFDFVRKTSTSLNLRAYLEHVNNTIFRVVNSFNHMRTCGPEYKIFSPDNTPLLYEHQCLTDESILIKNVHKIVLAGQDISMQTPKTGKCAIFRIEYMSEQLKQMVQEVIPDLVSHTTASILDFFSTNTTEQQTSLNYTNTTNYGMIDYNSTNSTDISSYDKQHSQDNTMLVNGLVLASAVTLTTSMIYLLMHMYNKYCKSPITQLETADTNISDPNLININGQTVKIYYSNSDEDGKDYAIVDIASKKGKYTKYTYDSSNPSSTYSNDHETMELISSTDDSTQDNINLNVYRLEISSENKKDYVNMSGKQETDQKSTNDTSHPSTSGSHIYETIDKITDQGYGTDNYAQDNINLQTYSSVAFNQAGNQHTIQFNSQPYVKNDINNKGSEISIHEDYGPPYDYPTIPPRPIAVTENLNFSFPVEKYHDDPALLGSSDCPC